MSLFQLPFHAQGASSRITARRRNLITGRIELLKERMSYSKSKFSIVTMRTSSEQKNQVVVVSLIKLVNSSRQAPGSGDGTFRASAWLGANSDYDWPSPQQQQPEPAAALPG